MPNDLLGKITTEWWSPDNLVAIPERNGVMNLAVWEKLPNSYPRPSDMKGKEAFALQCDNL